MTASRDPDRLIHAFLLEGEEQLHDQIYDAVRAEIDEKRQRAFVGPWSAHAMNRIVTFGLGAAAVVVVGLLLGSRLLGPPTNLGGPSEPTATVEPTTEPTPEATPRSDPEGDLAPGEYVAHPLPAPDNSLTVTFTVPEGWSALGDVLVPAGAPGVGAPGGMAIQLDDVTTLNGDPCEWSGTADDISVGPTVDDLVDALLAQTAYEVSDPVDVTIGGYSGKRVDIVHPTEPFAGESSEAPECDDGNYRLWSTSVHGPHPVYAQGPANRWQTNVLDVDGTRLVIITTDFPGTSAADRAEMDAIIDSMVIEP